jgi:hypothetical protein
MSAHFGLATNVVPPGNFHFIQRLNDGKDHRLEASSWPELENTVLRFRLEQIALVDGNRANPACVRFDIHEFVCANYPSSCLDRWTHPVDIRHQGPHQPVTQDPVTFQKFTPLIARISEWIARLGGGAFVAPSQSDKRAAICAKCPQNIRYETSCGPCNQEIRNNITRILGTRKTRFDVGLMGCRKMGWLNRIAVWLEHEPLDDDNLPNQCWAKKKQ